MNYNFSKELFESLVVTCKSVKGISIELGVSETTVRRYLKKYNLCINGISDNTFISVCNDSISMAEAAKKLNMPFTTFKRRALGLGCYKTNQGLSGSTRHGIKKFSVNENYFSIWSPQMAYWVGFIVADGSILSTTKASLRIILSANDDIILKRFKEDLSFTGNILYGSNSIKGYNKKYNFCSLTINSEQIVKDLNKLGIQKRKTYLDVDYLSFVPDEFKPYFVIGYFDGDGNISKNGGYISLAGNKVNCLSIFKYLSFTSDKYSIRLFDSYVVVTLRHKKDCYSFYDMYLKYSSKLRVLDRKKDIIKYFYDKFI